MTPAEARADLVMAYEAERSPTNTARRPGDARHTRFLRDIDALIAAVRAEERAEIVDALAKESDRLYGHDGFRRAADFVESLDRGEG